jgi:hypothetical protein
MKPTWLAVILAACGLVLAPSAFALNQASHAVVNRESAQQSNLAATLRTVLNIPDGLDQIFLQKSVLDWIAEGGIREDDGIRFFRHFHDSLQPWEEAGLGAASSSTLWIQRPMKGTDCNEWMWNSARCYFYQALSNPNPQVRERAWANTFRAMGQVMHLVVDAAVPEHARLDPHPLGGLLGSYEYWVEQLHGRRGSVTESAFRKQYLVNPIRPQEDLLNRPTGVMAAPVSVARLIDADAYNGKDPNVTLTSAIGVAEFANANFFSEDTAYRRWFSPNYPYPSVEQLLPSGQHIAVGQGVRSYYKKGIGDGLPVDPVLAECAMDAAFRDSGMLTPQYKCVDQNVWEQTALNMLPRAVGYASALIDYFFRGSLSVEYEDQTLKIQGSKETMVGDVQLLYDNTDGTRRAVTSWTGLRLEPNQFSPAFTKPQLPADAASGAPCWLVFRGQLGLETGAVVGSQIPCPTDTPSPPPPQTGTWAEYSCIYGLYGGGPDVRYHYATPDPAIDIDGVPVVRLFPRSASGEATCTLMVWSLPAQPLGSVTSHPF